MLRSAAIADRHSAPREHLSEPDSPTLAGPLPATFVRPGSRIPNATCSPTATSSDAVAPRSSHSESGGADRSLERTRARRERLAVGTRHNESLVTAERAAARSERVSGSDRQRAETGMDTQVHEDFEHCRALSDARAVARRRVREHCRAPSTPRAVARWRALGSLPARRERPVAGRAAARASGLRSPGISRSPQNRSAAGGTDRSQERTRARRERLVVGDRQRAATGAHFRVREDCEHCRAPSTSRAVAPRRYQ